MAPLHLQSQKLPQKTKWLWKVGPQVLPAQIVHKRSPLFQQECLRQGLHCTLEAHESCTFCAGRLIAGKVIKTLQTWRYVWSFTNLWRLNVIKWAGEITNLYKKFKTKDNFVNFRASWKTSLPAHYQFAENVRSFLKSSVTALAVEMFCFEYKQEWRKTDVLLIQRRAGCGTLANKENIWKDKMIKRKKAGATRRWLSSSRQFVWDNSAHSAINSQIWTLKEKVQWAHSINLDFVDFADFWMSWRIRLILISFCFRRFANQWNLRNPAPELDFSQISLISKLTTGARETWKLNLKAESSSGDPTYSALLFVLYHDLFWLALSLTPEMSDVKEKKPRSRAPAHVWTAGAHEANKLLRLLKGEGDEPGFLTRVKAKKFARGKAMARRRFQRRCETKGRRLKTTPCTWSGSFHDELCDPREGGLDQAVNLCGKWVTCPSHPFNCIYGDFVRLRLVPFLSRWQCSAACVDPLRCFRPVAGTCKSTPCSVTMAEEKKARSVVRIISSSQRNPRNPKLAKSMKSGLIERAQWVWMAFLPPDFFCLWRCTPKYLRKIVESTSFFVSLFGHAVKLCETEKCKSKIAGHSPNSVFITNTNIPIPFFFFFFLRSLVYHLLYTAYENNVNPAKE